MQKRAILSTVAISTLLLATAPAGAVSLNLGGSGGLVSVDSGSSGGDSSGSGSSSGGSSTSSGSGDGLLNLGGKRPLLDVNGDTDATVDLDLGGSGGTGSNGLVDLDSEGDDGVLVELFGEDKAAADAELGLGLEEEQELVTLDTQGDDGVILDLFGPSGAVADAELGLGEVGSDEVLDVNGDGGATANVNILRRSAPAGEAGTANIDVLSGEGSEVIVDLFGSDGSGADDVDDTATGSTPDDGTDTGAGTGDGGDTDTAAGSDGTDGVDGANGTGTAAPARPGGTAVRVATASAAGGSAGSCFSPNPSQIQHLLARSSYLIDIAAELAAVETVKLVPINLCDTARGDLEAALAANAEIGTLRSAIAADGEISAALRPSYQPEDVLAADTGGDDLTVYVY